MRLYVHEGKRKKMVGHVVKNVFYKEVEESKHLYQSFDAWGIDAEWFEKVIKGCYGIKILDKENNILYETTPEMYKVAGRYLHHKPHRAQIFLKRSMFTKTEDYEANKSRENND